MKARGCLLILALAFLPAGCGRSRPAAAAEREPLTVEQWTALPANTKYDIDTLERVKVSDPRFQAEEQWDQFARTVIVPAKSRDVAQGKLPK